MSLPAEIIDLIVEIVSTSQSVPRDNRLLSLALVSSAWTYACQRVIFHSMDLSDSPKNSSLLYALENRPILRSMTKRLNVRVFNRQDDDILSAALHHLTHVETLSVRDSSSNGILPNSPSQIYEGLTHVVSLPSLCDIAVNRLFIDPYSARFLLPFSCNKSVDSLLVKHPRAVTPAQCNANTLLASSYAQTSVLRPKRLYCGQSWVNDVSTFLYRLNSPSCEIDIHGIKDLHIQGIQSTLSLQNLLYTLGESLEALQIGFCKSYHGSYYMDDIDREQLLFFDLSKNLHLQVFEFFRVNDIFINTIRPAVARILHTLPANHPLKRIALWIPAYQEPNYPEDEMIQRDLLSWAVLKEAIMHLDAKVEVELTVVYPYRSKGNYTEYEAMLEREFEPLEGRLKLKSEQMELSRW